MKKVINIGLIFFVLSLWGTIVYKYINNYFYSDNIIANNNIKQYSLIKINERDTFGLGQLKRDPFLGKGLSTNKTASIKSYPRRATNKHSISNNNISPKTIPTIQYFGIIKSSSKKDELVIVKINNIVQKLRLNSDYNGVRIKKVFKDSILISFDSKQLYIKRN